MTDKEHGRLEVRRLWVSDEPKIFRYADFPHSQQFFVIERDVKRYIRGEATHTVEMAYGVTSLKKSQAPAKRLLELSREHWTIENKVHYVRDVTYDEDRCRIRVNNGPRMMASIRNLAISILRLMGFKYITDGIRYLSNTPDRKHTLALLGLW
jgi:predicted transposase YbfD/YdcC